MNKFRWNLSRNLYIFIQENAFENVVWKMAAILSLPQCDMGNFPSHPKYWCISLAKHKTVVIPLPTHTLYHSLALNHHVLALHRWQHMSVNHQPFLRHVYPPQKTFSKYLYCFFDTLRPEQNGNVCRHNFEMNFVEWKFQILLQSFFLMVVHFGGEGISSCFNQTTVKSLI